MLPKAVNGEGERPREPRLYLPREGGYCPLGNALSSWAHFCLWQAGVYPAADRNHYQGSNTRR